MVTTTPSLQVTGAISGGLISLTPGSSVDMNCDNGNSFILTPGQSCTITPSGGIAGQSLTLVVTTSGTVSRPLTFATPFKTSGTLSTGNSNAKKFVICFIYDGTNYIEKSRTAAL